MRTSPPNTWIVLLRGVDFTIPSFKVFAHNLTHEDAKSQADEIHEQRVEGERVTRVYIVDAGELHEEADPKECDACRDLIIEVRREELAILKQEMDKRGLKPKRDSTETP